MVVTMCSFRLVSSTCRPISIFSTGMKAGIVMAMLPCFFRKSFARFSGVRIAMFTEEMCPNPHRGKNFLFCKNKSLLCLDLCPHF